MKTEGFENFSEFYPFYLSQHSSKINRDLHVFSTFLYLSNLIYQILVGKIILILLCPVLAYGPAWYGHFYYEKNIPATFKYPFYSLTGDFFMVIDILTGRLPKLFEKYGIEGKK